MPYVITTKRVSAQADGWLARSPFHDTRTTVATLDEAHDEAAAIIERHVGSDPDWEDVDVYTDAQDCSELGGTFGPLSDGTVIEVRRVPAWVASGWVGEAALYGPDNTHNV